MAKHSSNSRRRDRLRMKAVAARERFKALAATGSFLIGALVGFDEYAHGMGGAFSAFAAILSMAISGAAFGIVALAIKVDDIRHR